MVVRIVCGDVSRLWGGSLSGGDSSKEKENGIPPATKWVFFGLQYL